MNHQKGQSAVLLAIFMVALLSFTALAFMAGSSWIMRRNMQTDADTFALSFGSQISGQTCADAPNLTSDNVKAYADYADSVIVPTVGAASSNSITGICSAGWVITYNHPNNLTLVATYPYNHDYRNVLATSTIVNPLQLSALLGLSTESIQARAVARHAGGGIGTGYALMAHTLVDCTGTSPVNMLGSIYAEQSSTTNKCGFYAHAIQDANGVYTDYGNFTIYNDGSPWNAGGIVFAGCNANLCADGYELAGHVSPVCGTTGSNQFLNAGVASQEANPCTQSYIPPVLKAGYPLFPEPNVSYPNPATGFCSAATNYGAGAAPTLDAITGLLHFHPGCYSSLDISTFATGTPVLDPGFYYFNGVGNSSGGGLCLGSTARLLGKDISLEFVNATSLSVSTCSTNPASACGLSANCGFGADPAAPVTGLNYSYSYLAAPQLATSAWCTSTCALSGVLIWSSSTGSFFLKGSGEYSWLQGSVYWPSTCTWWANGSSSIQGQIICNIANFQGGASSTGNTVSYNALVTSSGRAETTLIE